MKYLSFLLPALLLLAGFTLPKLKTVKINKEVTVALPRDFKVMPDEVIAAKYPAPRKPLGAFTSPNGQVDFIVSERPSTFKPEDLAMLQQFYRSTITNSYSEVKFIREEVKQINNRQYIIFEFTSTLRDDQRRVSRQPAIRRYTLVQYTIAKNTLVQPVKESVRDKDLATREDKLLVFTFNAPIDLQPAWQETARKIMQSIKLTQS
jgi:hypothetical protein